MIQKRRAPLGVDVWCSAYAEKVCFQGFNDGNTILCEGGNDMRLADRRERLMGEGAFDVLAKVKELEAQGKNIISFAIGEPDFDTPAHIKEAAMEALRRGETHYSPSAGIKQLRESVARYIEKSRGVPVRPEEVVVCPGAKPALFCGVFCCVNEGDEVIYPSPCFPAYESLVRYVGAVPVPLPLKEERVFSFDPRELEALITPKTKMIIINTPQNPTGGVLPSSDLDLIAELAVKHDLWVLADEIYCAIIFDAAFDSILSRPGMKERTILVDGFSKTYAMTGWRLGYAVVREELVAHFSKLLTNSVSCTATFTQWAGVAALEGPQDCVEEMVASYKRRRDMLVDGLNEIPGFKCLKPQGAFYAFANVTGACRNLGLKGAEELQDYLLNEAGVAVLARTCFGNRVPGEIEEYVRFCFATSENAIKEGLSRIRKAVS